MAGARTRRVRCQLPAGRLTLYTDHKAFVSIQCEPNASRRAGRFRCEELEEARAELQANGTALITVKTLEVTRCELHGPLNCVLALAGVASTGRLHLSYVPTELRPEHLVGLNTTNIHISNKAENATSVPYEALGVLPQLRELFMGDVQHLAESWRPALHHLEKLELDGLLEVPARRFDGLPKLRTLALWGHTIEYLHEEALTNLSSLDALFIKSTAMKSVPSRLLLPTPLLTRLLISDYQLQYLPRRVLSHLQNLEMITISNENFTELHLEAGNFAGFPKLQRLIVKSCAIRAVPADLVRGSPVLVELSLKNNLLATLPGELLAEQAALQVLVLAMNHLHTLPQNLLNRTTNLRELDLSRNVIEFLPKDLFKNLSFLKKLDLSNNRINQLDQNMFENLRSIEQLSLANNALTRPYLAAWQYCANLKILDLSNNVITELSDFDLNFNSNALVDLESNNISQLSLSSDSLHNVDVISARATFRLADNPFVCDCNLYNFVRALEIPEFARRFLIEGAYCAAPVELAARRLRGVAAAALACALRPPACPARCACATRPAAARLELACHTPPALPPLAPLRVAAVQLRLRTVPADLADLPPEVRLVDLSGLGLTVAPVASRRVDDLTVDLSNNNLTTAPLSLLRANCTVRLAGNEFECDCNHYDSIATLERHWAQLEDGTELKCRGGGSVVGSPAAKLCAMRSAISLGGSLAAVGLLLGALGVLAFRYSTEIRLVLRRYEALDFLFEEPPDPSGLEKAYDAFVSFSHRDFDFVHDELVPQLEGGRRPLRLCLHYRDWEIGEMIPEQIARSVSESRRTIVVMSRDFLKSKWGRVEFRAAHGLERVILLLLGDVLSAAREDLELRSYLTTNTYVLADDPLVWDRVRDAVLRSRRPRPAAAPAIPAITAAPTALPLAALPAPVAPGQVLALQ
ncbi:uncharacterized protein [Epargyreus clarus]|uniref:uncharacterized protein n=1 Tax=Epargyreus clarus TaxID=520877 RepID=UPI003C2ADB61